ncbi:GNAT family N-acetyltransferase [Micromonospora cathayae]|uniref:GNAT family N-acetyltransferase n=1 Tax=Micromonospora cathayae TaxID=3028804 RepID=A0ABY7ZU22_9ACTN|nr:GNAT family N-acetyltransferase [Micromonospora sp. HUAS 3]WDZ86540.1 GNAT family N-acetyltransferase [Micromonospora sp. HUAS 3]
MTTDDLRYAPVRAGLAREYRDRYGVGVEEEMSRWPDDDFTPPRGGLVLLLLHGETVAGGGFHSPDGRQVELRRIWTDPRYRRRGLARRVVTEIEARAVRLGCRRAHLLTGPRQPEADALYRTMGYRPVPVTLPAGEPPALRYEKDL